jgi:hypothetical protein
MEIEKKKMPGQARHLCYCLANLYFWMMSFWVMRFSLAIMLTK